MAPATVLLVPVAAIPHVVQQSVPSSERLASKLQVLQVVTEIDQAHLKGTLCARAMLVQPTVATNPARLCERCRTHPVAVMDALRTPRLPTQRSSGPARQGPLCVSMHAQSKAHLKHVQSMQRCVAIIRAPSRMHFAHPFESSSTLLPLKGACNTEQSSSASSQAFEGKSSFVNLSLRLAIMFST
jgi:hypothetical protein